MQKYIYSLIIGLSTSLSSMAIAMDQPNMEDFFADYQSDEESFEREQRLKDEEFKEYAELFLRPEPTKANILTQSVDSKPTPQEQTIVKPQKKTKKIAAPKKQNPKQAPQKKRPETKAEQRKRQQRQQAEDAKQQKQKLKDETFKVPLADTSTQPFQQPQQTSVKNRTQRTPAKTKELDQIKIVHLFKNDTNNTIGFAARTAGHYSIDLDDLVKKGKDLYTKFQRGKITNKVSGPYFYEKENIIIAKLNEEQFFAFYTLNNAILIINQPFKLLPKEIREIIENLLMTVNESFYWENTGEVGLVPQDQFL